MNTIGKQLKIERKNRGLTQSEMCQPILSTSYYAKVEKGYHKIAAEDLLSILKQNKIDIIDFFISLEKKGATDISYEQLIHLAWSEAHLKQDIPKLHRLKKSVDHNQVMSKKQKALLLALLDLSIAGLSDSLISMPPDTKQLLQNYLFTLPTWNKLKLSVYGNALRVYTIESNQLFINSNLKKELTSYTLSNRCIILTILLNFISMCIESNQDKLASNYLEFINRETSFPENFFQKTLGHYFTLLLLARQNKQIPMEELTAIYTVLTLTGLSQYATELEIFFKNHTSIVN